MNSEFQKLKGLFVEANKTRQSIIDSMRYNLKGRNGEESIYSFRYTEPGRIVDIDVADVEDLFAIDGDMNPCGK